MRLALGQRNATIGGFAGIGERIPIAEVSKA